MNVKKSILIGFPFLIFMLITPYIAIPIIHNYDLEIMSKEFYKQNFELKSLPMHTEIIKEYSEIAGPYTSNYCALFVGVLLETTLDYSEFNNYYSNSTLAWLTPTSIIINRGFDIENTTFPLDCLTCLPKGVKKLFSGFIQKRKAKDTNNVIIFEEGYFTSNWDVRCT